MLSATACRDLADTFRGLDYTVDAVVGLIGEQAHRALGRNSTIPAVRALGSRDDPLATLTRLWPLQQPVAASALEQALPGLVEPLTHAGLLTAAEGGQVSAAVDIRPYASDDGASGWVVSDLSPNLDTTTAPVRPDFVLGVSPASTTLAQLTVRRAAGRALDLGTGCGVQSLHLARHCDQIVATDLNPRALDLTGLTLALNGVTADLRLGSLYEPVRDDAFDLITTNPPYVLSPPSAPAARLTYREGDHEADGLVAQIVRQSADHLHNDGLLQVLGNWAHVKGQDWTDRIHGWVDPTGCDAHVVQREVLEPGEYIELWLADAGLAGSPAYADRYREWLDYFEHLGIEAVGLGWLVLHRAGHADPSVRIEDWPHPLEQPIGPALAAEVDALALLRTLSDVDLLTHRWRLATDVVEETTGVPGAGDPQHLVLRQQRGFRRGFAADTATAAVLGACDGDLSLGQLVSAVAELLDLDPQALAVDLPPVVRQLVLDGYLTGW